MEQIQHLIATRPVVALHLFSALLATVIGAILLTRRKGTGQLATRRSSIAARRRPFCEMCRPLL